MKQRLSLIMLTTLALIPMIRLYSQTAYTYTTMSGGTQTAYAWQGNKVAISAMTDTLHDPSMAAWLGTLDLAYDYYKLCTGQDPTPYFQYNGKLSIAQVNSTVCGGAACGYLGSTGIEIMTPYFYKCYDPLRNQGLYNQVPFYELGRNFWYYGNKLNYGTYDLATGYAIFMRFKSMAYANAPGAPFGQMPFDTFKEAVRMNMDIYLADTNYTWTNTFGAGQSVNGGFGGLSDLFASLYMYLDARTCNDQWTKNFWKFAAQQPNAQSVQDAVDNFIVASSLASNENQVALFQELHWPISQETMDYLNALDFGTITNQPPNRISVQAGNDGLISITSGNNAASFRWHELLDGTLTPLNNNSTFGGVSTANLIINNVTLADSNTTYLCRVIIAGCDTVYSEPTQLLVFNYETPSSGPIHTPGNYEGAVTIAQPAELLADAGLDITDPNGTLILGGNPSASGGQAPYSYVWSPTQGLDDPALANPTFIDSINANYTVQITDARGCTATDSVAVILLNATDAEGNALLYTVYPNPVSDALHIRLPENLHSIVTIRLLDPAGKLVQQECIPAGSVNRMFAFTTAHLPAGHYLLSIEQENQKTTTPIIIRH